VAEVCDWSAEERGGGNEQIPDYFSQMHVCSLNNIMHNEYHEYPLVATTECFVWCRKIPKMYICLTL